MLQKMDQMRQYLESKVQAEKDRQWALKREAFPLQGSDQERRLAHDRVAAHSGHFVPAQERDRQQSMLSRAIEATKSDLFFKDPHK